MSRAALALALLLAGCGSSAPSIRVAGGDARRGPDLIEAYGCGSCHTIPGVEGADAGVGPPLIRWSERAFVAGRLPNTQANLVRWIRFPQDVEPGTAMPNLDVSEADARDIAAYLYTLGDRDDYDR